MNRLRVTPWITLIIGLSATISAGSAVWNSEQDSRDRYIRAEAGRWFSTVASAIEKNLSAVESLAATLQRDASITRQAFTSYAEQVVALHPAIETVKWVPRVAEADRNSFEQRAQAEGLSSFIITEYAESGGVQNASSREVYYPVFYTLPMSGNEAALGIDLRSSPPHRKAMSEARDRGIWMAPRPVDPARSELSPQTDILVLMPVYGGSAPSASMEQDNANLKGFALVVVDMAKAINAALASRDKELFLAGFKATKPADASAAFELGATGDFVAAGAPVVFNSNLGGRSWEIALTPSVKLIPTYTASSFWLVLVIGILASITAAAFHRRAGRETKRLTKEIALRCAQAKSADDDNRALLEGVRDGVIGLSADEQVLFINGHARRMLGLSDETLGRPIDSVMKEAGIALIDIFNAGYVGDASASFVNPKTGEEILLEINAQAIEQGTHSSLGRLITLREVAAATKPDELALRLGLVLRESLFEVFIFDADTLQCVASNELAQNNTGYPESELAVIAAADILGTDTFQQFQTALHSLGDSARPMAEYEGDHRRKDGSTYPVSTHVFYASDETPPVVYAFVEDISERIALRQQLQNTAASLVEAQRVAQRMDAVARLAGGIAHDFNNSLGIVIGNLDLLSLRNLDDKARRNADTALAAATQGAELSRQLLNLARRDVARLNNANVNELLEGELRRKVEGFIQGGVDVSYDFGEDLWPVEVESGALVSAITNLVINASDALQGRPGKIVIETRNRLGAPEADGVYQGEYVDIVVSDNGIGIPREHLDSVFDPFYTTKQDTDGAGLGLAMVYAFAKRFGGEVTANSEVGYGSAFRVSLPRVGTEAKPATEDEPSELVSGNDERVLVVDDQAELAAVAVEYLESAGYNVNVATGASEALDLLARQSYDLIFSDIVMPGGMNGFQLATEVERQYPEVQILLTSGFTAAASDARDPEARRRRLLSKPYSRAQLLEAVRSELD